MSQAGDYGERRSEPWTYSRNELPHRLYSKLGLVKDGKGKPLRPRYRRKRNFLTIEAVQRMMAKIVAPPEGEQSFTWAQKVIQTLRTATLEMLDRILPFIPGKSIEAMYEFCLDILDRFFGIEATLPSAQEMRARALIIYIADRAGLIVTIKKG